MKIITNLRIILEYFEIPNRDLAEARNTWKRNGPKPKKNVGKRKLWRLSWPGG